MKSKRAQLDVLNALAAARRRQGMQHIRGNILAAQAAAQARLDAAPTGLSTTDVTRMAEDFLQAVLRLQDPADVARVLREVSAGRYSDADDLRCSLALFLEMNGEFRAKRSAEDEARRLAAVTPKAAT